MANGEGTGDGGHGLGLLAADTDREAAMSTLAVAYAHGRLDETEYSQRLDQVVCARFVSELDAAVVDLPVTSPAAVPIPTWRFDKWPLRLRISTAASANAIAFVAWQATNPSILFYPTTSRDFYWPVVLHLGSASALALVWLRRRVSSALAEQTHP